MSAQGGLCRNHRGATLIEILISVTILGMAVIMIYSVVAASTSVNMDTGDYEDSIDSVQHLSEVLRNYVTADASAATANLAPTGSWRLPGDSCPYALATGCVHQTTGYIKGSLLARHPSARLSYTVSQATPDSPQNVSFSLTWR